MYHLPFISYYVIDTFGKVFWTFLSILFMYFRGENTSLNLDFIPIGYVHCSYICAVYCKPWVWFALPPYTQYPYSLLFGADPLFAIFCRCALEYLMLLSFFYFMFRKCFKLFSGLFLNII